MGFTANSWGSPGYGGTEGGGGSTVDSNPVVITPGNGWVVDEPLTYQRRISGVVEMAGLIYGGTTTPGTLLFTLPVGRRPTADVVMAQESLLDIKFATTGAVTIDARYPGYSAFLLFYDVTFT